MKEELATRGVKIIAISKDSVKDAARHKHRAGLTYDMLSNEDLAVIRQFGLEQHKAVEFSTGRFTIFGISLALAPPFKTMAIPTTLLVDEHGVIRWIDQADVNRLRSKEERVMLAVGRAFA